MTQQEQSRFVNRRKKEEELERLKPRYPYTVIRVLLEVFGIACLLIDHRPLADSCVSWLGQQHDKVYVQGLFNPYEPCSRLFEFIESLRVAPETSVSPQYSYYFHLPPQQKIKFADANEKNFVTLKLVPAATMTLKMSDGNVAWRVSASTYPSACA